MCVSIYLCHICIEHIHIVDREGSKSRVATTTTDAVVELVLMGCWQCSGERATIAVAVDVVVVAIIGHAYINNTNTKMHSR